MRFELAGLNISSASFAPVTKALQDKSIRISQRRVGDGPAAYSTLTDTFHWTLGEVTAKNADGAVHEAVHALQDILRVNASREVIEAQAYVVQCVYHTWRRNPSGPGARRSFVNKLVPRLARSIEDGSNRARHAKSILKALEVAQRADLWTSGFRSVPVDDLAELGTTIREHSSGLWLPYSTNGICAGGCSQGGFWQWEIDR